MKLSQMSVALFALLVSFTSASFAGQLFPPENIGSNPSVACPDGGVLSWSGTSVKCVDPTAGVNVTCDKGLTLTGINYGKAVCVDPTGAPSGTLCGAVFYETRNTGYIGNLQLFRRCKDKVIIKSTNRSDFDSDYQPLASNVDCPTGYSYTKTAYSWVQTNGYVAQYRQGSCAKD